MTNINHVELEEEINTLTRQIDMSLGALSYLRKLRTAYSFHDTDSIEFEKIEKEIEQEERISSLKMNKLTELTDKKFKIIKLREYQISNFIISS